MAKRQPPDDFKEFIQCLNSNDVLTAVQVCDTSN